MVRVVSTDADNANVVWQEPYPPQGNIDQYRCQYGVVGAVERQERQFPAHSPCDQAIINSQRLPSTPESPLHCGRIDGLQPEQQYQFQVPFTFCNLLYFSFPGGHSYERGRLESLEHTRAYADVMRTGVTGVR